MNSQCYSLVNMDRELSFVKYHQAIFNEQGYKSEFTEVLIDAGN